MCLHGRHIQEEKKIGYFHAALRIPDRCYYSAAVMAVLLCVLLRKGKLVKRVAVSLLVPYLFLVLYSTVFRRSASGTFRYDMGLFNALQRVLINAGRKRTDALAMIAFNTLMLVPLGLLLPVCIKQSRWVIPSGFLFSLLIELLQFFLRRGFFELDDLFCNTLGAAIGLGLYAGIDRILRRRKDHSTR